ncbi:MAG: dipeptide epimerase, partial [Paracoccaceae bacterium]
MQVIKAQQDRFPLSQVFRIARGQRDSAQVITVNVEKDGVAGRGEGLPYARYGETPASVLAQIRALPNDIALEGLSQALPPGAARNAVECALWDLQAKQKGCRVWDLLGIAAPQPVISAMTISLDAPGAMHQQALKNAHHPVLKIKLGAETDLPRLQAVRKAAPQSDIIIDANEGWSADG